jgi:mycothiol system anti-sigma-R factor
MRSRGEVMAKEQRDVESVGTESAERPTDACVDINDCDQAIRQLYSFLDNELTEELRAAFEAHLDRCVPCVEVVTFESELRRVIADRCQDRVPEELVSRIAAAISREAGDRR